MEATTEERAKVAELVKAAKIALFTTVNGHGQLVSRPLGVQEVEFDGDLWFFTQHPTDKTAEIAAHPQVNVAFESGKGYVSIAGTAELVLDKAKAEELWSKSAEAWFPDGREDPTIALIKVHAETAEYWSMDHAKPVVLFKIAKAYVTGGQPDAGDNKVVEL